MLNLPRTCARQGRSQLKEVWPVVVRPLLLPQLHSRLAPKHGGGHRRSNAHVPNLPQPLALCDTFVSLAPVSGLMPLSLELELFYGTRC